MIRMMALEVHRLISSAVKAAYASNKHERMELINA